MFPHFSLSLGLFTYIIPRSDAGFLPWSNDLRQCLLDAFPLDHGVDPIPEDVLLKPKWSLSLQADRDRLRLPIMTGSDAEGQNQCSGSKVSKESVQKKDTIRAKREAHGTTLNVVLDENRRLTPDSHWQDVRCLTLTSKVNVTYMPGDVLTIYPKNPVRDVNDILRLMDWTEVADQLIEFKPFGLPKVTKMDFPPISVVPISEALTLRDLLTDHLDLHAIPRRSFFSTIAHFTKDTFQKDRLTEFTKPEFLDELYDYTTRPRRSILEVLQEFDTVKIPWQWAANILPELRGRQFSIASGGTLKHTKDGYTRFELLVAIVKYKTVIKKIREGVCTRYIAGLPAGSTLRVTLQKGSLGITRADVKRPIVMVGPGTGIAPIRSLIWERLQWIDELAGGRTNQMTEVTNGDHDVKENIIFFGSRNRDTDYFYETEWQDIERKTPLQVFTAFSRDQKAKIYVQDRIREQTNLLFRMLYTYSGIVYICGSSGKMPQAVRDSLIEVFQVEGHIERDAAEEYLTKMEKEGRYKQETW